MWYSPHGNITQERARWGFPIRGIYVLGDVFLLSGCYKKKRLQHKDRNGESLKRALLPNPQVLQHMQVYRSQTHKSNRTAKPPCVTSWLLVLNCIYYRRKQSAPWLRIGLRPIYWAGLLPLFHVNCPCPSSTPTEKNLLTYSPRLAILATGSVTGPWNPGRIERSRFFFALSHIE